LYRGHAAGQRSRSVLDSIQHTLVHETLPYPDRFRLAAATGKIGKLVQGALPRQFYALLDLLPDDLPQSEPLPEVFPAEGSRRARVALLAGCVQQALAPEINWATLRVLARNGVEVVIPRGQGCCGSLGLHAGELERARGLARLNLRAFPKDVDAVVTNAAGCGSGMKEYGVLFAGQPEEAEADAYAARVKDVAEFLDGLGLAQNPPALGGPLVVAGQQSVAGQLIVAYHDACHLAHAQGITTAPRRLLSQIPNLTLAEIPEGEMCCGSAGTYNLEQPALAATFGERKARNVLSTQAQAVVTGNIGCLIQIRIHLQRQGRPLPVWHTLELLDRAYRGE
jgi:glycolate oxidase iron-sulfur subunit